MSIELEKFFLPYQVAWINADGPLVIGEKSRRIGWTYASAARAVIRRLETRSDLFYTSADQSAAREFVEEAATFARVANVVAEDLGEQAIDEQDGITAFVLRFADGQKIYAGSSNPKFFRGKGGDADADEYAFHAQPRELFKAMHATAMVWGYRLRIWSTHNGEGSAFNGLVKDAKRWAAHQAAVAAAAPGGEGEGGPPAPYTGLKAEVQTVTILDAVEQGLVEKIKRLDAPDPIARRDWLEELRSTVPDQDTWNEEYMCQPSSEESSLLSYTLIQGCEAPNLQLQDVAALGGGGGPLYGGFDVARKGDLSSLWTIERVGDVFWTRVVRVLRDTPFHVQEGLLNQLLLNPRVKRVCVDSTGLGMDLAERLVNRWRHRVEPVSFTGPVKAELALPLVRLFEDRQVRVPADAEVREDLHSVRKTVTTAGNIRLDAERTDKGHGDRFWSLALAYHAAEALKTPLPAPLARKPVGW